MLVTVVHDVEVVEHAAPAQVVALDGGAGGAAGDDAAALQHVEHQLQRLGALVGIHEVPLPAAAEPDARRFRQRLQGFLALHLARVLPNSTVTFGAGFAEDVGDTVARGAGVSQGDGQRDDARLLAAGQIDEALNHSTRHAASPNDDERTLLDHGRCWVRWREGRLAARSRRAAKGREIFPCLVRQCDRSGAVGSAGPRWIVTLPAPSGPSRRPRTNSAVPGAISQPSRPGRFFKSAGNRLLVSAAEGVSITASGRKSAPAASLSVLFVTNPVASPEVASTPPRSSTP